METTLNKQAACLRLDSKQRDYCNTRSRKPWGARMRWRHWQHHAAHSQAPTGSRSSCVGSQGVGAPKALKQETILHKQTSHLASTKGEQSANLQGTGPAPPCSSHFCLCTKLCHHVHHRVNARVEMLPVLPADASCCWNKPS